jgi:serine/threonine protein kinase
MIEEWFGSRATLTLSGVAGLRPKEHGHLGIPVAIAKGQATNYLLVDHAGGHWYLKRFLAGKRPALEYVRMTGEVIPRRREFSSGWRRAVLASGSVRAAAGSRLPKGLPEWLDGAVLAPSTPGTQWAYWIENMTQTPLGTEARLAVAADLARLVAVLEACQISHRDLSGGNVLVDSGSVALIDWDTMFHAALPFQQNSPLGSLGYMAPWVADDVRQSWRLRADRFALAIMVAEALTVAPGITLQGDGSLFRQEDFARDSAPKRTLGALGDVSPTLRDLFEAAWKSTGFDGCPSALDWAEELGSPDVRQHAETLTALYAALSAGSLVDAVEALSRPMMGESLSAMAQGRLDALRRSVDELRQALASGNRRVLAMLAREGLVVRASLRASAQLELDQAVRAADALDALEAAIPSATPARVRLARQAVFRAGAAVPPHLRAAVLHASRNYAEPTPSAPPPRSTSPDPLAFDPFDPESVPSRPRADPTPQSIRHEMELHIERGQWEEACSAWFQLRAMWPEEAAAVTMAGDHARRMWGAQLMVGERY